MLYRAFLVFTGILLIVMSIAGYMAPEFLGGNLGSNWTPTIWLLTGLIALGIGLAVHSWNALRWTAGILGAIYLIWGIIALFTMPVGPVVALMSLLSLITVAIGAAGLAVASVPADWLRGREEVHAT